MVRAWRIPACGPDVLKAAAKAIALCLLYKRRGIGDQVNPWTKEAAFWREKLDRIGKGEEPLSVANAPAAPPALLITEPAKTYSEAGNLMV